MSEISIIAVEEGNEIKIITVSPPPIGGALVLGETSTTAYQGDRGKTAYDHSQLTTGNPHNVTKAQVGLGNVDNTSDLNKPISTVTQTALNAKENTITAGTTSQFWRGDKSWQTLDKTAVGLGNVDNTSDLNKPISTATQTALNAKANNTVTITAGTGLSGGGDLSANRTLTVSTIQTFNLVGTAEETLTPTGTTQTIDWSTGACKTLNTSSATGHVTLTLSNPQAGSSHLLKVVQGSTARNIIFPVGTISPTSAGGGRTLTASANKTYIIALVYVGGSWIASWQEYS